MLEYISLVANHLPSVRGKVSNSLSIPAIRHLHYITIARFPILQYCCRLLLASLKVLIILLRIYLSASITFKDSFQDVQRHLREKFKNFSRFIIIFFKIH